ncbi:MAG: 7TM domain-containing protein [Patescibacteria group bacterium]
MKKIVISLFSLLLFGIVLGVTSPERYQAEAQETNGSIEILEVFDQDGNLFDSATDSSEATNTGKLASVSAEVEQKIQEKKDKDITDTSGKQKGKLASYLDEHPTGPLSWHNPLQVAIRAAIEKGLPANIIVLLLMFPIIASIIAASRHVVGLKGFGIYIPAVLAVALVSTGILTGLTIFIVVLAAAIATRTIIRKFRMPYLPRTAMLMWGVSIVTLLVLIGSVIMIENSTLLTISIFPVLIIILLTENFIESQQFNSQKEAIKLTVETIFLSILCSIFISNETLQKVVILRPELTLLLVAFINYAIGKYSGLRFLEYLRFREILNNNNE